jgi:hypothetical protein
MQILGLGLAGATAAVAGTLLLGRRPNVNWGKTGEWLYQKLALKDGSFSNFDGMKALVFWGWTAYGGWIHASRNHHERREQVIKAINFTVGFQVIPEIVKAVSKGNPRQTFVASTVASILALGLSPALLNIWLTKSRIQAEAEEKRLAQESVIKLNQPFEQWLARVSHRVLMQPIPA